MLGDSVIVAQCTPKGSGALAIVRLSGQGVFDLVAKMSQISSGKTVCDASSHTIVYGFVTDCDGQKIDEVLFFLMRGPKTFTGEDTIEISCHNNQLIVEGIIATAIYFGARHAIPGEFTKRAVLHKKIDIIQAEAIHELITATSNQQLRIALAQKEGSLSFYIATIEQLIYEILCFCQASFEFIEEEDPEFYDQILQKIHKALAEITHIKTYFNQQQRIKEGIRIAIIGSVNAGKSSLFNALLKKSRALVSSIPGTTRDSIEAHLFRDGAQFTLIDTAGIRKTNDQIEECGIVRSYEEADLADIVLLLIAADAVLSNEELTIYQQLLEKHQHKALIVLSKSDMPIIEESPFYHQATIRVSIHDEVALGSLEQLMLARCKKMYGESTPFLISVRQFDLLLSVDRILQKMEKNLVATRSYELIAADAVEALEIIAEVTGKTVQERAMDAIFQQFCVGK